MSLALTEDFDVDIVIRSKGKKESKKKTIKPGPIKSDEGIPYDYIIVIDSGSSGSRVFIYNWLNPYHALTKGIDMSKQSKSLKLVKKFSSLSKNDDDDSDSDSDDDEANGKEGSQAIKDSKKKSKKKKTKSKTLNKFPKVHLGKNWHTKIKPGISSFNESPQKIGKHHFRSLLQLASAVVPKSQHSRTPIFVHATAGMRTLPPNEQYEILDNICSYLTSSLDFYLPDCKSHVNVIDGDIEGIYGWLSINYLIGSFDNPEDHQHGQNHTTYGLLDMGGALTQVVFQPNVTEVTEHRNNLYKINVNKVPLLANVYNNTEDSPNSLIGDYYAPEEKEYNIYSDSFLGFGMFQAHNRYLKFLTEKYREEHHLNEGEGSGYRNEIKAPVSDPCLPKGYTVSSSINDRTIDFVGESNFEKCLESIFPVLLNGTHSTGTGAIKGDPKKCKPSNEDSDVSSCLLNDLIPSFDFDVNHFIGVSGYWDTLTHLLSYEQDIPDKRKIEKRKIEERKNKSGNKEDADTYDYKVIYKETTKLCSQSFSQLIELNNFRPKNLQIKEDALSELCFKSSWILNFLHLGLGFPRFGIDKVPKTNKNFKSLQLVDKLGGSTFSWTLGRALLYANDEYVQAFNNYTLESGKKESILKRPGYYYTAVSSVYHYGAEENGIRPRPQFQEPIEGAKYHYYEYENDNSITNDHNELKWYIEPHRWYGIFILMFLLGFIIWLMLGRNGRSHIMNKLRLKRQNISDKFTKFSRANDRSSNSRYSRISNNANDYRDDLEQSGGINDFELSDLTNGNSSNDDVRFKSDSDEEVS